MDTDKKPRADSKLDNLPPEQWLALRDGLLDRTLKSYAAALEWLRESCGVDSSQAALSGFYARNCAPVVRERRQFSALRAEALGAAMAADPVNWDDAIVERTKQLAFEFLDEGTSDPDAVSKLLKSILQAKREDREDLRLKLDREKFQAAQQEIKDALAAPKKADGGLTPETLRRIEEAANLL